MTSKSQAAASAATFAAGLAAGAAAGYVVTGRGGHRTEGEQQVVTREAVKRADNYSWTKVFDSLRTGVCIVAEHGEVSYANSGALDLGLDLGPLENQTLRRVTDQVRDTAQPRQFDLDLGRQDDSTAVRVNVSALPDGDVAVELTDISELHRVERVRRDFVANVGHELKTPVGALQLLSEALADAVDDPRAAARFTARIQHESARMSRLVSELLELSRLQGAEPMPALVTVHIDQVIGEAIDRSRTAASAKDISLIRTGRRDLCVSGSENQLATALGNLVGNAIAYSPEGTSVTIDVGLLDGMARIAVTDEGSGIAEAEQQRIFERFYRPDPARSRATGGTGLGLAIVKHIAGNHSGSVEVSSMPGYGATFTLALPAVPSESDFPVPAGTAINTEVTDIEEGQP